MIRLDLDQPSKGVDGRRLHVLESSTLEETSGPCPSVIQSSIWTLIEGVEAAEEKAVAVE